MSEVKPTGGAWHVERRGKHLYVEAEGPTFICDTQIESAWESERGRIERDAALIAEAGTVYHETGKTPRQLADDVARLRSALADCKESLTRLDDADGAYRVTCIQEANAALAATEARHA